MIDVTKIVPGETKVWMPHGNQACEMTILAVKGETIDTDKIGGQAQHFFETKAEALEAAANQLRASAALIVDEEIPKLMEKHRELLALAAAVETGGDCQVGGVGIG